MNVATSVSNIRHIDYSFESMHVALVCFELNQVHVLRYTFVFVCMCHSGA